MSVVGLLLAVIYKILEAYLGLMVVTLLLSFTPIYETGFGRLLRRLTDPYLGFFYGRLVIGSLDLGPLVGLLLFEGLLCLLAWGLS